MVNHSPIRRAVVVVATALLLLVSATVIVVPSAQAVSNSDGTTKYTNTYYAYVKAGERIAVTMTGGSSMTVTNEQGSVVPVSGGQTPIAAQDGVWRVRLVSLPGEVGYDYTMRVLAGATERKGRIWIYTDIFRQNAPSDIGYFGVSDLGYIYQIKAYQTLGVDASIALRSTGAAPDTTCKVENRSFDIGAQIGNAYLDCGEKYRLFLEDPRGMGLPTEAKMGNTTTPVLPTVVTATELSAQTQVSFAPNQSTVGGTFTVTSHTAFSGTAEFQLDANNNGTYTDAVDIKRSIIINSGTTPSWVWDGKGATGVPVSGGGKARVVITKIGEAHLLLHDFEQLGGLVLNRLNGSSTNGIIRWDDSALTSPRGGTPTPTKVCLGGCNSSVAGGIHGWDRGADVLGNGQSTSWGDSRVIDNWTYETVNAVSLVADIPAIRTVAFDGNGGTVSGVSSITRTNGFAWGTLPTASVSGKVFLGWAMTRTGGTPITATTLASASTSGTAYAQWRPARFNVVFDGNAQMGVLTGSTASVSVDSGCTTCLLTANGFTKTTGAPALIDHDAETTELTSRFLGWSLDPASRTGDIPDRAVAGAFSTTDGATVRLYAVWDDAPWFIVESYPDRLFTLDQARSGAITEAELLSTVRATDKETTPLETKTGDQIVSSGNDIGITVHDYDASDFISLTGTGVVTVTYKVKDAVGHVAFLRIHVTVTDDSAIPPASVEYLRGISPEYAGVGSVDGGFPSESLWLTDPTRQTALADALDGSSAVTYCLDADAVSTLREQATAALGSSVAPDGLAEAATVLREGGSCS